jgi:hypothetical protein
MTARVGLAACDGLIRQRSCGRGLSLKILTKRYVTERAWDGRSRITKPLLLVEYRPSSRHIHQSP